MRIWNYLRARGEYSVSDAELLEQLELPPRTRRILNLILLRFFAYGTTSAHAENTASSNMLLINHRNYLRARGEYFGSVVAEMDLWELPPRTRRIQPGRAPRPVRLGTTSAHAENTLNELGLL